MFILVYVDYKGTYYVAAKQKQKNYDFSGKY